MTKKEERQKVKEKCNGRCAYCGETLGKSFHIDHKEPVCRESEYIRGKGFVSTGKMAYPENDTFENLLPACVSCNLQKSDWDVHAFRTFIQNKMKLLNSHPNYKFCKRYGLIEEKPKKIVFYFESLAEVAEVV